MDETRETVVTIGEARNDGKAPNFMVENAQFFGRPNFSGELDRFKDNRRKFTLVIPKDAMEPLRAVGYNVKETIPTPDEVAMGREPICHLKVIMNFKIPLDKQGRPDEMDFETGPDVWIKQGENLEKLNSRTVPVIDKSRFESFDVEIRGWEFDHEEQPGVYSARLVSLVGNMRPSMLAEKYGNLR